MVQQLAGDHTRSLRKARERSQVSVVGQEHRLPRQGASSQPAGPHSSTNPRQHPKLHEGPRTEAFSPYDPKHPPLQYWQGL